MAKKDIDKLVRKARGESVRANVLRGTRTPIPGKTFGKYYSIYSNLYSDEQPHYIAANKSKGFRITDSSGNERTPHHSRFGPIKAIVVTDQRIHYVAGKEVGIDSHKIESSDLYYEDMNDVQLSGTLFGSSIIFYMDDSTEDEYNGVEFKFKITFCGDKPKQLYQYVSERI